MPIVVHGEIHGGAGNVPTPPFYYCSIEVQAQVYLLSVPSRNTTLIPDLPHCHKTLNLKTNAHISHL